MKRHPRGAKLISLLLATTMVGGGQFLAAQQAGAAAAAPAAATTAAAPAAPAPAAAETAAEGFSEELEALVAPIALYSDSLLAQILMAATYPIEVVEAERFMKANPGLKDAALEEKLKEEDWDTSVKSLCTLPDVLDKLSQNLDWTQDLGDAFLGQQTELMDTVQSMRSKAVASGNLETSEQQTVTMKEEKIIVIESPNPQVVYVPTYSPSVVYGGWAPYYPYYPPMYPYYPIGAGLVTFGVGVAVGAALWGGCHWGRGRGGVYINHHSYNNFSRNTNINHNNLSGDRGNFNHNAAHRKGVGYQNQKVAGQYGAKGGSGRVSQGQAQARGYSGSGSARTQGASATQRQGASAGQRQGAGGQASASRAQQSGTRAGTSSSGRSASSYGSSSGRSSAYSGSRSSSSSRYSSSRGAYSRGSSSYGGYRGGGGMRGGGGRRR